MTRNDRPSDENRPSAGATEHNANVAQATISEEPKREGWTRLAAVEGANEQIARRLAVTERFVEELFGLFDDVANSVLTLRQGQCCCVPTRPAPRWPGDRWASDDRATGGCRGRWGGRR